MTVDASPTFLAPLPSCATHAAYTTTINYLFSIVHYYRPTYRSPLNRGYERAQSPQWRRKRGRVIRHARKQGAEWVARPRPIDK